MNTLIFLYVLLFAQQQTDNNTLDGFLVEYDVKVGSDDPITSQGLAQSKIFPSKMALTFTNGYYKMVDNHGEMEYVIYDFNSNTQYSKKRNVDTLSALDCSKDKRSYISMVQLENKKVLNVDCECIKITSSQTAYTYCYSKKYSLNLSNLKNHHFGFYSKFAEKSTGPYLYFKLEYDFFWMEYTAIKIKEKKIPVSFFDRPNLPTIPSKHN